MRSLLFVRSQEVHLTLIEITKELKKKGLLEPFCIVSIFQKKINHHKQGIPVHPGWHHRIVPKH